MANDPKEKALAEAKRAQLDYKQNVAAARKARRKSFERAQKAGSSLRDVGQLERGERVARIDTVIKLAGSLGIPPEELLDGMSWEPGGTRLGRYAER